MSLLAQRVYDWNPEQIDYFCKCIRRNINNPKYHCHFKQRVAWGRKPLDATLDPSDEPNAVDDDSPKRDVTGEALVQKGMAKQGIDNGETAEGQPAKGETNEEETARQETTEGETIEG